MVVPDASLELRRPVIWRRQGRPTDGAESVSSPARASLDALFAIAARQAPHWRLMTMRLPQRGATQVTVMIEEAASLHPYPRSTLTLDAATAGVVKWEPFVELQPRSYHCAPGCDRCTPERLVDSSASSSRLWRRPAA